MIVHFVRKHYAQPGVTVTESKLFHDSHAGIDREVDVVIEGNFDGEPMLISNRSQRTRPPGDHRLGPGTDQEAPIPSYQPPRPGVEVRFH
jgi:hypothetical protein